MKALILAAGYGTRLYSIVKDTPKALLKINGKALIGHILDRISVVDDLDEVIVVTNDKFFSHFEAWREQLKGLSYKMIIINDRTTNPDDRLGSIGDIKFVLDSYPFEDDLLVVGGDNLFNFNIKEYIQFSQSKSESVTIGLFDIHDLEQAKKFGVVQVNNDRKICSFEEKPQQPKSTLIAMCFYYLPKVTLGLVSEYLRESGKADRAGDYIRWLTQNNNVYGFKFTGKWYDIGSVESYNEAQKGFK